MTMFPTTRWSRILRVEGATGARAPDLDALARAYWRPIQAWLRAWSGAADGDASDATQDFFVWVIERERLAQADPARGRFRAFLKTMLRRFAIDRERRRSALKRGGGAAPASLSDEELAAAAGSLVAREPGPDAALDAAFRAELVARASARLEEELAAAGRASTFALFRDYFLAPEEDVDYRRLAEQRGISTAVVSNELMHAKRRFRALLRAEVSEMVGDSDALADELRWLFGTDGP
jgi:RNA polymerase sigma-70 factor (ECF subfamily)